jgi:hypothetical protein
VLHTHSRAGVAVSAQKGGVLPISQQSTFVLASLAYHAYEGVALRDDEKPAPAGRPGRQELPHAAQPRPADVGKTIADAFLSMYTFENTCRIQIDAQAGGELVHVNPQDPSGPGPGHEDRHRRPGRQHRLARAAAQAGPHGPVLQDLTPRPAPHRPMTFLQLLPTLLLVSLALVMFGLGFSLATEDFRRLLKYPKAVVVALVLQVLALPAACYLLIVAFGLPPVFAVGLMLLAASPGGVSANLFSHLFGGNVAMNISLTAINTILSIATLPLIANWAISHLRQDRASGAAAVWQSGRGDCRGAGARAHRHGGGGQEARLWPSVWKSLSRSSAPWCWLRLR